MTIPWTLLSGIEDAMTQISHTGSLQGLCHGFQCLKGGCVFDFSEHFHLVMELRVKGLRLAAKLNKLALHISPKHISRKLGVSNRYLSQHEPEVETSPTLTCGFKLSVVTLVKSLSLVQPSGTAVAPSSHNDSLSPLK